MLGVMFLTTLLRNDENCSPVDLEIISTERSLNSFELNDDKLSDIEVNPLVYKDSISVSDTYRSPVFLVE